MKLDYAIRMNDTADGTQRGTVASQVDAPVAPQNATVAPQVDAPVAPTTQVKIGMQERLMRGLSAQNAPQKPDEVATVAPQGASQGYGRVM